MNKIRYSEIKQSAKGRMKGHFGEAFLALAVIPLLFSMAGSAISMAFGNILLFSLLARFFITVFVQYITIILALKLSKGNFPNLFTNLFGNSKSYINMVVYSLIALAFMVLPMFIYMNFFIDFSNYFANIPVGYIPSEGEIQAVMLDLVPNTNIIIASTVLSILAYIVSIKLFFTPYLIVDKNMAAIDAIKLSWKYTNGNFFRVLFFPLSFILWYLLIFVTCGLILIYVIPYVTLSFAKFYEAILYENDENFEENHNGFNEIMDIPLEKEKKEDPLDDYYE